MFYQFVSLVPSLVTFVVKKIFNTPYSILMSCDAGFQNDQYLPLLQERERG